MAHYHFHVNPGPKGTGANHAQYIAREGRFKAEKYGEIGEKESGNLPPWARGSAARFFAAADEHERANGNSYRELELELALPVELSDAQRGELVREFVAEQIGSAHAYSWAIHEPKAHNPMCTSCFRSGNSMGSSAGRSNILSGRMLRILSAAGMRNRIDSPTATDPRKWWR